MMTRTNDPPTSTLLLIALLTLLPLGCTNLSVERVNADGTRVKAHATSLFSNTTLKGLTVDGATKTTTNLLRVSTSQTEPNAESITATGTALGELIGTAAKAAAGKP